ncbi:MAG: hypothetical protein WDN23_05575 [Edaphobacter sp.]
MGMVATDGHRLSLVEMVAQDVLFTVLHRVFGSLDWGKPFISNGYDWLQTKLHSNFFP